jgi:PHD/YefM family antitoxin component YafN of YafNO toxin-antitoxin module
MMIKSAEMLQSNFKELADHCDEFNEPVFLTEGGEGRYVLMSTYHYESLLEMLDIQGSVLSSIAEWHKTGVSYTMEEVDQMMREAIDEVARQSQQAA